jgi:hypothetical protein
MISLFHTWIFFSITLFFSLHLIPSFAICLSLYFNPIRSFLNSLLFSLYIFCIFRQSQSLYIHILRCSSLTLYAFLSLSLSLSLSVHISLSLCVCSYLSFCTYVVHSLVCSSLFLYVVLSFICIDLFLYVVLFLFVCSSLSVYVLLSRSFSMDWRMMRSAIFALSGQS